ncbi:hypothetical protein ACQPXH_11880 [Nocardia sp. CA-135953]|uniref:hypothetical protein n=1 Tax=Nocardia sp. CA-135953 TaxID=3239978 RepID=UPI003D9678D5
MRFVEALLASAFGFSGYGAGGGDAVEFCADRGELLLARVLSRSAWTDVWEIIGSASTSLDHIGR